MVMISIFAKSLWMLAYAYLLNGAASSSYSVFYIIIFVKLSCMGVTGRNVTFCYLIRNYYTRISKDLFSYWFEGICASFERYNQTFFCNPCLNCLGLAFWLPFLFGNILIHEKVVPSCGFLIIVTDPWK